MYIDFLGTRTLPNKRAGEGGQRQQREDGLPKGKEGLEDYRNSRSWYELSPSDQQKALGFIICWMPFFVLYLIEVFAKALSETRTFTLMNEFFLWLGYSNSVCTSLYLFK